MGLLESAMYAPFQTFGGEALYPSIQAKAAKLGFGIVGNHPFLDGNKRTGAHVMLIFFSRCNNLRQAWTKQLLVCSPHIANARVENLSHFYIWLRYLHRFRPHSHLLALPWFLPMHVLRHPTVH